MELIKTPSFNAMENLADVLSQNNKNFPFEQIYNKLIQDTYSKRNDTKGLAQLN